MQAYLRSIRRILTIPEQRILLWLMLLAVVTAFLQVVTVAAIMPFVAVLLDPGSISEMPVLGPLYQSFGMENPQTFIVFCGAGVLALLLFSNAFLALDLWISLRFTFRLEHHLACRLLSGYLRQPWTAFGARDQATLSKNVLTEVQRATVGTIQTLISLVNDFMMVVFLGILLLVVDPWITLTTLAVLAVAYTLIYLLLQGKIDRLGASFPGLKADMLRTLHEALRAFREIRVSGRADYFVERFSKPSRASADNAIRYHVVELLPILLLETIAFGMLIAIAIFAALRADGMQEFIPVIALYGLAAYRLVPAIKEVFGGVAEIQYNRAAFVALEQDLVVQQMPRNADGQIETISPALPSLDVVAEPEVPSGGSSLPGGHPGTRVANALKPHRGITLKGVNFRYTGARPALVDIDLDIQAGTTLCIVGPSGSGKSTLIDMLLGLLQPDAGEIRIDDQVLAGELVPSWQRAIGYVPQSVLLLEDTLRRNIAFGVADAQIDELAMRRAAHLAEMAEFIEERLPEGYDTRIGEQGLRLSGGQQQRIGIARALYHAPPVLILDEASSALDVVTETAIMNHLVGLPNVTILFVSHKANVAAHCREVAVILDGRVAARDSYRVLSAPESPWRALFETDHSVHPGADAASAGER